MDDYLPELQVLLVTDMTVLKSLAQFVLGREHVGRQLLGRQRADQETDHHQNCPPKTFHRYYLRLYLASFR